MQILSFRSLAGCTPCLLLALTQSCSPSELVTGDGAGGASVGSGGSASGGTVASGGTPATGGATSSGGSGGGPTSGGASSGGSGGAEASGGGEATGGSDGGTDFFGASRCDGGDFLLCDGFEGADIDASLWTVEKGSNTAEIVSDQAARGAQSVHLHVDGNFAYLKNTSIFPVTNNDYFGRMFLRVARFSTVDWAHWTVGEAAGTGDGSKIRVGGQYKTDASANRWGIGSDGGPTGDWTTHDTDEGPTEPPTSTWVCLEWEHKGSTNETHFYVDDVLHPSLSTTTTEHGGSSVDYVLPNVTSFWFGWWQYQADPEPFDVWIDELVLDDERIGCTK